MCIDRDRYDYYYSWSLIMLLIMQIFLYLNINSDVYIFHIGLMKNNDFQTELPRNERDRGAWGATRLIFRL